MSRNDVQHNNTPTPEAEAPTPEAEAPEAEAPEPTATPGLFDFLGADDLFTPVKVIRIQPIQSEVPLPIQGLVERVLKAGEPMKFPLPDAATAKTVLRHIKAYADAREAGRLTVRAVIQRDGKTIHMSAKIPAFRAIPPDEVKAAEAAKAAEAEAAEATE